MLKHQCFNRLIWVTVPKIKLQWFRFPLLLNFIRTSITEAVELAKNLLEKTFSAKKKDVHPALQPIGPASACGMVTKVAANKFATIIVARFLSNTHKAGTVNYHQAPNWEKSWEELVQIQSAWPNLTKLTELMKRTEMLAFGNA